MNTNGFSPDYGVELEYSSERRRLETVGVAIVVILAAMNATKVVVKIHEQCAAPWPRLAILGGWIIADFVQTPARARLATPWTKTGPKPCRGRPFGL